jgi:transcriptional regulator with GAF, ATPase, and Fis domain
MRLLTGADIIDFYTGRDDLLVITDTGEFVTLDESDLTGSTDAYGATTTHDGTEVTVLLKRETIDDGEWFPDALDDGDLTPAVADEMANIINNDAGLQGRVTVQEIRDVTAAWEKATAEADRLAAERARRIAEFARACGSQSHAARLLGLDQSTVNKLVRKAETK